MCTSTLRTWAAAVFMFLVATAGQSEHILESGPQGGFPFLVIEWDAVATDVDLHVFDPAGAHFYWNEIEIQGRPGFMVLDDNGDGQRKELWALLQVPPPGEYVVVADLFKGRSANVRATASFSGGRLQLFSDSLSSRCLQIGTIVVAADGDVRFHNTSGRSAADRTERCLLQPLAAKYSLLVTEGTCT